MVVELSSWEKQGFIVPYNKLLHGEVKGILPVSPVVQMHKSTTVRPVLDFTQLNKHTVSNPGNHVKACEEMIRKWRTIGSQTSLLDIRKAYLQVHVDVELQSYQCVVYNGQLFVMTRMAFGLGIARKVLDAVVEYVCQKHGYSAEVVSGYVDDIMVDESKVSASEVAFESL